VSGRITPKSAGDWGAVVPQWLGIFGLVAQFVVWLVTYIVTRHGVVEPAFLTAFGGLIVVGQGAEALVALRSPTRPEDDPTTDEEAKR
jgi:hypothetical protein